MAHLLDKDEVTTGEVIHGRPDFTDHGFGRTIAKSGPAFVYGRRKGSGLVHHVAYVELDWWGIGPGGHTLHRVVSPRMWARTKCGAFFTLKADRARTCAVPAPGALVCRACEGRGRNFRRKNGGRDADTGLNKQQAGARLGCLAHGGTEKV